MLSIHNEYASACKHELKKVRYALRDSVSGKHHTRIASDRFTGVEALRRALQQRQHPCVPACRTERLDAVSQYRLTVWQALYYLVHIRECITRVFIRGAQSRGI